MPERFEIYPNPAQDHVVLKGVAEGAQVRVFDLSGRQVFQGVYYVDNKLSISKLVAGIYIIDLGYNRQLLTIQ